MNYWLSSHRVHPDGPQQTPPGDERSPFLIDYDRIIFSSAFRRLQDKTQVFPLSVSDYTRTRLTHSLEVASVGRTLARRAFRALQKRRRNKELVSEMELSAIVGAACLAHDIGNPPLGHSGEQAIGAWMKKNLPTEISGQERKDLEEFEGNAQGFRILTRLQMRDRRGGMRPTAAMIGALAKYPRPSVLGREPRGIAEKKFGFFKDDEKLYRSIYQHMGFRSKGGAYPRHPLAFLVEAADDICYGIIDLEDAHKLGIVSYEIARDLLQDVAKVDGIDTPHTSSDERIARLRAAAIGRLIDDASEVFANNLDAIEKGTLNESLLDLAENKDGYESINRHMRAHAYTDPRVLTIEAAGYRTLGGLLEIFVDALLTDAPDGLAKKLRQLFPKDLIRQPGQSAVEPFADMLGKLSPYQRYLAVTDFVSGMTDTYAVDLYQRLSGIRI